MTIQVGGNTVITTDRIVQLTNGATASRPASPTTGQLFYDTTVAKLIVWNGTAWKEAVASGGDAPALWAWGRNADGRLGLAVDIVNRSSPVTVVGGYIDWILISAGQGHSGGIRADGSAWFWGSNSYGKLGNNTAVTRSSPVSVVGDFKWVHISAGGSHSSGIRSDGTMWSWGNNLDGGLGFNNGASNTARSSPVSVVGGFTDWIQVDAGGYFQTVALRANGTAWTWGRNSFGQLGTNDTTNRSSPVSVVGGFTDWVQVAAGRLFTSGVRANGTIWSWGINFNGQLGLNSTNSVSSPSSLVGGFTDWIQVSVGSYHQGGIRANGTAWGWGYNANGQLGDGSIVQKSSPVSVVGGFNDWIQISAGEQHNLAIRANGTAWAWGLNNNGQLGNSTLYPSNTSPVSILGGFTDWVQVSAGGKGFNGRHSIGLRSQPMAQNIRPGLQRNRF